MVAPQRDPPTMPPVKPARADEADQLARLIAAIHDQTAAMRELAESNRQVVDLVIAQQAEPQDEPAPRRRCLEDPAEED